MIDELQSMVQKELATLNKLTNKVKSKSPTPTKQVIVKNESSLQSTQQTTQSYDYRPMLSKKSLKMAEKLGDPLERLTRPRKTVTPDVIPIKTKRSTSTNRWEQLYSLGQFYKTKKDALRAQLELEKSKENIATFHPDVSKSQLHYCDFLMPFDERNRYWEAKKLERLQTVQQEINDETKSECTFKPMKCKTKSTDQVRVSDFNKKGLVSYFERVQLAQKLKEPQIQISKWQRKTTIPQEFKLGRKRIL